METVATSRMIAENLDRWLQAATSANRSSASDEELLRNRILYIAYLCVLGCCCITPCLYYIRMSSWQRRQFREFREMERNAIISALAQSTASSVNRMNTTMELAIMQSERRARILQLMEPVRMTLEERHFQQSPSLINAETMSDKKDEEMKSQSSQTQSNQRTETNNESGETAHSQNAHSAASEDLPMSSSLHFDFDADEETIFIQIPCPGLAVQTVISSDGIPSVLGTARTNTRRWIPGFCTICLSSFELGHDIVWSSNSKCEHCFHTDCMQQWLTKQQPGVAEGPICPCCRQDFVVDPYDLIASQSSLSDDFADPERNTPSTRSDTSFDTDEVVSPIRWGDDERSA